VILVTVLSDAALVGRVAIVSRLGLLGSGRGSDSGGRLGVVGDFANDAVGLSSVEATAVKTRVQVLEVSGRHAPAGSKAVASITRAWGGTVAAVNTAADVADGAGGQQLWQEAEDESSLGIHYEYDWISIMSGWTKKARQLLHDVRRMALVLYTCKCPTVSALSSFDGNISRAKSIAYIHHFPKNQGSAPPSVPVIMLPVHTVLYCGVSV
jgi:hypothetical protein